MTFRKSSMNITGAALGSYLLSNGFPPPASPEVGFPSKRVDGLIFA